MQNNPDIASLLSQIQQRLTSLENKIDALAGKVSPSRLVYSTPPQEKIQKPDNRNNRNRPMFKAICADCKKECEVPFRPSGDRPVYCRECFASRKAGNSLRPAIASKPKEAAPAPMAHIDSKQVSEKKKPAAKKKAVKKTKPVTKKQKKKGSR
jgi:CxxC-x17-CxxC domain-containing protein